MQTMNSVGNYAPMETAQSWDPDSESFKATDSESFKATDNGSFKATDNGSFKANREYKDRLFKAIFGRETE